MLSIRSSPTSVSRNACTDQVESGCTMETVRSGAQSWQNPHVWSAPLIRGEAKHPSSRVQNEDLVSPATAGRERYSGKWFFDSLVGRRNLSNAIEGKE